MSSRNPKRTHQHTVLTDNYCQQRDLIVQSAGLCFERNGVGKTTLVDVAREAKITRELIYYYFDGKQDIIDSLLDEYVDDAVDTAQLWCDTWDNETATVDDPLPREAILDAFASIRRFMFVSDNVTRPMFAILDETGKRQETLNAMCKTIVQKLGDHRTIQRLKTMYPRLANDEDALLFKFVVMGALGLMENTSVTDEQIVDLLLPADDRNN